MQRLHPAIAAVMAVQLTACIGSLSSVQPSLLFSYCSPAPEYVACCSFDAWLRRAFPGSFPAQGYVFDYRPDMDTASWQPFVQPGSKAAVRCAAAVDDRAPEQHPRPDTLSFRPA